MFWAVRQLSVPCKYLAIASGPSLLESKAVYDFVIPGALTALTVAVCVSLDIPISVSKLTGVASGLSTLLALLIGFYMAALAAVATFHRDGIDQTLDGYPATLWVTVNGERKRKELTYRQYISYLFGYLSFLSLVIYGGLLVMQGVWPRIISKAEGFRVWPEILRWGAEPFLFISIVFLVWQLLIVSLQGIYFLSERLQTLTDKPQ